MAMAGKALQFKMAFNNCIQNIAYRDCNNADNNKFIVDY